MVPAIGTSWISRNPVNPAVVASVMNRLVNMRESRAVIIVRAYLEQLAKPMRPLVFFVGAARIAATGSPNQG